jgi:hypothetical protein
MKVVAQLLTLFRAKIQNQKAKNSFLGKKITRFKTIPKVQNLEPKKKRND